MDHARFGIFHPMFSSPGTGAGLMELVSFRKNTSIIMMRSFGKMSVPGFFDHLYLASSQPVFHAYFQWLCSKRTVSFLPVIQKSHPFQKVLLIGYPAAALKSHSIIDIMFGIFFLTSSTAPIGVTDSNAVNTVWSRECEIMIITKRPRHVYLPIRFI